MSESYRYRLPDGQYTKDADQYVDAWRAKGAILEKVLPNFLVSGFDPGFLMGSTASPAARSIDIPMSVADVLIALHDRAAKAEAEVDRLTAEYDRAASVFESVKDRIDDDFALQELSSVLLDHPLDENGERRKSAAVPDFTTNVRDALPQQAAAAAVEETQRVLDGLCDPALPKKLLALPALDDDDWLFFHDVVVEAFGTPVVNMSRSDLRSLFQLLPQHIQDIAIRHGLDDTPFRDDAYGFLRDIRFDDLMPDKKDGT